MNDMLSKESRVEKDTEGAEKLYGCAICLKQFSYRDELKYHYESDHTGRITEFIVNIKRCNILF